MKRRYFEYNIIFLIISMFSIYFFTAKPVSGEAPRIVQNSKEVRSDINQSSPFAAIEKTYAEVNTLTAKFNQNILISSLKKDRTFAGHFFYKRHKGFLWQYVLPKGKYFLYDGSYIWQGEDEKTYVQKSRVDRDKTDGTFLDLVEDISKLDEFFNLKHRAKTEDGELLELLPKKDSTIRMARVWIDRKNLVKKIELHEFTGNVNTIEFVYIKVNQSVEDSKFIFKLDIQKEIVER